MATNSLTETKKHQAPQQYCLSDADRQAIKALSPGHKVSEQIERQRIEHVKKFGSEFG